MNKRDIKKINYIEKTTYGWLKGYFDLDLAKSLAEAIEIDNVKRGRLILYRTSDEVNNTEYVLFTKEAYKDMFEYGGYEAYKVDVMEVR